MGKNNSIFIGLSDIIGYNANIAKNLHNKGYNITYFICNNNIYHPEIYPIADNHFLMKIILFCQKKYQTNKTVILKYIFLLLRELFIPFLLLWAIRKHKVFIFSFGHSFVRGGYDLWLLKKLGKRIIFNIGFGADSRPPFLQYRCYGYDGIPKSLNYIKYKTYLKKKTIQRIEKYSDIVINSPYTSHFNKKFIINSFALGIPVKFDILNKESKKENTICVLHSPSNPLAKGTECIRTAINELTEEGYKIEYIEITGVSQKTVIEKINNCDFVVDQLYSDSIMPGFSTEAAFFGKASVISGYGLDELKKYIPKDMLPPTYVCHPDKIKDAIKFMIENKDYRIKLGQAARKFVQNQWNPDKVTDRFIQIINNKIPQEWYINPKDITYVYGCSLPKEKSQRLIKRLIDKYGVSSLQLNHHPDLEKAFIKFANSLSDD